MTTALFAYEFGAGLGHLQRLLAIAKRLAAEGVTPVFALPDHQLGDPLVRAAFPEAAIVSSPRWGIADVVAARKVDTRTLADILRIFRFDDMALLGAAVARWRAIVADLSPDLIVSDFAPSLSMIARGKAHVVAGNGYTIPPCNMPFVPIRSWDSRLGHASRINERRILDSVNAVARQFQLPAIDYVSDLFSADRTFACTLDAFDPYSSWRGGTRSAVRVSPFNMPDIVPGPAVSSRNALFAFAYLPADHPQLRAVLAAMSTTSERCGVYVSGSDPARVAAQCGSNVAVHRRPAPLGTVLPDTKVIIHHGGLGTATAALMAATPQLCLPLNLEHHITTRGVASLGAGVDGSNRPIDVLIERLSSDGTIDQATQSAARDVLHNEDRKAGLDTVIDGCQAALAGRKV